MPKPKQIVTKHLTSTVYKETGKPSFELVQYRSLADFYALASDEWEDVSPSVAKRSYAFRHQPSGPEGWKATMHEGGTSFEFRGSVTWDAFAKALASGYDTERVARIAKQVQAKAEGLVVQRRRRRKYGLDGELDAQRYADGLHDSAWVSRPRTGNRISPITTVYFEWGGNCDVGASELTWSGAAAVALCSALEAAGWRCGIYALATGKSKIKKKDGHGVAATIIPVKQPEEPLRVGQVSTMCCLPATYRTLEFRNICNYQTDMGSGLGSHVYWGSLRKSEQDAILAALPGNAIRLESARSEYQAVQAIASALDKLRNPMMVEA